MRAGTALFQAFEKSGFKLVRTSKHAIWNCPCGHARITSPITPSHNALVASEGQIARTLRACKQRLKECA